MLSALFAFSFATTALVRHQLPAQATESPPSREQVRAPSSSAIEPPVSPDGYDERPEPVSDAPIVPGESDDGADAQEEESALAAALAEEQSTDL